MKTEVFLETGDLVEYEAKIYDYEIWNSAIDLSDAKDLFDVYRFNQIDIKSFRCERKTRELDEYSGSDEYINCIINKPLNNEGLFIIDPFKVDRRSCAYIEIRIISYQKPNQAKVVLNSYEQLKQENAKLRAEMDRLKGKVF